MLSNILLDKLPEITPNGFKIQTDFRNAIKFELLMQDNELSTEIKIQLAFQLFYDEIIDVEKQIEDIIWFYTCGKEIKTSQKNERSNRVKQIYSYEFDAGYIYSAFVEQYNIDLQEINMHWWKFKALFEGLNKNIKIIEIMGYRALDINKIKDKEERKYYKKLQKQYELPDMRSIEEKEADFGNLFW